MKKTKLCKIVIFILLVSLILHFCYALININHECTHNDDCTICMVINMVKNRLEEFDSNLISNIIIKLFIFILPFIYLKDEIYNYNYSLVKLKVQLNN